MDHKKIRSFAWGIAAGIASMILQAWAGQEDPLRLLVPALVLALVVAVTLELWPRWLGARARTALSSALAHTPVTVEIHRRQRVVREPGEPGLWDFRRDGERAMIAHGVVLAEMSRAMEKSSKRTDRHNRRLTALNTKHPGDIERAYSRSAKMARDTERFAAKLERLEVRLRAERVKMIDNNTAWLEGFDISAEDAADWADNLQALGGASTQARVSQEGYRDSILGLRNQNSSQPVNRATEYLASVVSTIIENIEATERFCYERVAALSKLSKKK